MKKQTAILLNTLLLCIVFIALELASPHALDSLDARVHDFLFTSRGEITPSGNVVIIDIDEKSLQTYGQWPWSRNIVAKLIDNLSAAGAGIIGLDIVFAEADATSPSSIANKLHMQMSGLDNYDTILAHSIADAPLIGGYFFNFDTNSTRSPSIPAIFLEKGLPKEHYVPEPQGITLNIQSIQDAFYSSGFFNNLPDEGGMIRSVPLIMRYHDTLYPSLVLEMIRIYTQNAKVYINNSDYGVESISLGNLKIPTDRHGRLHVNFRGPTKSFTYISAKDVLNNAFDTALVEGKFVLVGTSAIGLSDLRATPFDDVMPGIELHANAIDTILEKNFLVKKVDTFAYDLMIIIAIIIVTSIIFSLISELLILPVLFALLYCIYEVSMYTFFELGLIVNILMPVLALLVSMFSVILINYIFTSSQKRQLQKSFAKKVSPQVMEDIISHSDEALLVPKEKEISIFFSDIRSFTNISEQIGNPSRLITMLNQYMTPMVDTIIAHNGTIDKFIGDAVMAYWNAPVDVANHQDKAVVSALEQLDALKALNTSIKAEFDVKIDIGIGIHSGNATIGEMGSSGRSDYTIIGDSVNLASRLEGLCKPYGVKLIISEFTKAGLKEIYTIRDLDIVKVKGKTQPVKIYEVIQMGEANSARREELEAYNKALLLYRNAKFSEAKKHFDALHVRYNLYLYTMYAQRCETLFDKKLTQFDGVYTFTTK